MHKFLLGLVLGLAGGGAIGYFYCKKKDEDYITDEIRKVKDFYEKGPKKDEKKPEGENLEDVSDEEKEAIKNHEKKIPDKPIPKEYKNLTRTYAADDGNVREEAPDEYFEDEDPAEKESPKEDRPDYEFISNEEQGELPGYSTNCIIYYTEDDVFAYEENNEQVDDPRYLIGDILENWKKDDDAESNVFVRNNRIAEDFEVVKFFGCFGGLD